MRTIVVVLSCFSVFVFFGCKENSTSSNNTDQLTSDLRGKVTLVNYLSDYPVDKSGVLVQCVGLPYSCITDTGGNWTLKGLPTRSYHITFTKDGYVQWEDFDFSFTAGEPGYYPYTGITLYQPPRYSVTLDGVIPPTIGVDSITKQRIIIHDGFIEAHTGSTDIHLLSTNYVTVYFSLDSTISQLDSSNILFQFIGYTIPSSDTTAATTITAGFPRNNKTLQSPFPSGTMIYVQAFPALTNPSNVFDPITGNTFTEPYQTKGSNVLSFIIQ